MKNRVALVAGVILFAGRAMAEPAFLDDLTTRYKKSPSIKKFQCFLCHADGDGGGDTNPFGDDYYNMIVQKGDAKESDYKAFLDADSNKNGKSNREELAAGTNPGATKDKKKK